MKEQKNNRITQIKIIQDSSEASLQDSVNAYIIGIQKLGAKVVGSPQFKILKINTKSQWIQDYKNKWVKQVKENYIKQYNKKHSQLPINIKTPLKYLKIENKGLNDLIQKNITMTKHINPIRFYAQVCYQVSLNTLLHNKEVFY